MAKSPILFIELANAEAQSKPNLNNAQSWLLTSLSSYPDRVILGFGAPGLKKGPSLGRIFDFLKPKSDGFFEIEIGATAPDLLPNPADQLDYSVELTVEDIGSKLLCISNQMRSIHYEVDGQQIHVVFPAYKLEKLQKATEFKLPAGASPQPLRSTATMRFAVAGVDAEEALEENIERCIKEFTAFLNRFLAANQMVAGKSYAQFSTSYERNSFPLFYILMQGAEANVFGHGRLATHAGHVALNPPSYKGDEVLSLQSYLSGTARLNTVRLMLISAKSSVESGQLQTGLLQLVIAAEMATSQYIKAHFIAAGVSNTKWEESKKELRYSDMVNLHLWTLTPKNMKPDRALLGQLNRARGLRNDFMHEGIFKVDRAEMEALVRATEDYLAYIDKLEMASESEQLTVNIKDAPKEAPSREEIAICAYNIWEKEGRPEGRDRMHWFQAEDQLKASGR